MQLWVELGLKKVFSNPTCSEIMLPIYNHIYIYIIVEGLLQHKPHTIKCIAVRSYRYVTSKAICLKAVSINHYCKVWNIMYIRLDPIRLSANYIQHSNTDQLVKCFLEWLRVGWYLFDMQISLLFNDQESHQICLI